jgi:hypothetical protein
MISENYGSASFPGS